MKEPKNTRDLNVEKATRQLAKVAARSFDAAAGGRLNPATEWMNVLTSGDTQLFGQDRILREMSRDLYENNPYCQNIVNELVANLVGPGIIPKAVSNDPDLNEKVMKLFKKWSRRSSCDMDGEMDFYALQSCVAFQVVTAGEVLIQRGWVDRSSRGYVVPLKLRLLEADYIDSYRNGPADGSGNQIIQGIEVATSGPNMGTRSAYWLYPVHPGSYLFNAGTAMISQPHPASEILHIYNKTRTRARGVPWGASTFTLLRDLAEYELAERVRKRTESCIAAIVTTEDDSEIGINRITPDDDVAGYLSDEPGGIYNINNEPIEHLEPGLIGYARGGKTISFTSPAATGGYSDYKISQLQGIAAGWGVPYEVATGDLRNVSFISGRMGTLGFRKRMKTKQKQLLAANFLTPVWEWFCEAAYLAGEIDMPYVDVEWQYPAYEYLDPVAEVTATNLAIRSGQRSWQEAIYSMGRDPDIVFDEIVKDQERNRKFGVVLDSDPSVVSGRGVAQKNAPGQAPTEPKGKKKKKDKKGKKAKSKSKDVNTDDGD